MTGYCKCSNRAPTSVQICIALVHAVLRPKMLGKRLGILTYILIAIDYCFFCFYISEKYFEFRGKERHLLRKIFGLPHTNNRIYLLQNCFSNCVLYLKDMYITLNGTGKIMFASVLIILLICKFLNFTAVFTKNKLNFPKFAYNLP